MIKVAVTGAAGRMGSGIIRKITEQDDMEVVAAIEIPETPLAGEDAGVRAGIGEIGVKIVGAEKLEETLKETNPDVLVDFTIAHAAAETVKKAASLISGSEGFMIGYKLADKDGTWVVLMNGDKSEAKSLDTGIDLTNAVVYADENSASVEGIANPSGVKLEGTTATLEPLTAILLKVAK